MKILKMLPIGIIGIGLLLCHLEAWSQGVAMHTQGITQQEFLNPAYNSFKDQVSFSAYSRMQWNSQYVNSPEYQVANLYLPFDTTRLGMNVGVIRESLGLRKTTELKLSLCHNLRVTQNGRLSFGYSVGFLQSKIDREKIINYPDEDLSFIQSQVSDFEYVDPTVSVGVFYLSPKWYVGVSSMTTSIRRKLIGSSYLPGFDFSGGAVLDLNDFFQLKPGVIVKYYNDKEVESENGVVIKNAKIPAIYDFGLSLLIANRVLVGTSYRLNQAQTFSLDLKIGQSLKVGYTFELGIGEGLNQYNSNGIRLAYSFKHRAKLSGDSNKAVSPNKKDLGSMSSFLY